MLEHCCLDPFDWFVVGDSRFKVPVYTLIRWRLEVPSLEWKENFLDSALNQVIANGGAMWGLHVIVIGFVLEYMMINHALLDMNGTKGLSVLHILNYQRTELKFAWFSAGDLIWDFTCLHQ